jgi:serine/threonine protein kinase
MASFDFIKNDFEIINYLINQNLTNLRAERLLMRNFKKEIQQFDFAQKIGQGSFGQVFLAREIASGKKYAIKKKENLVTSEEFDSKSNPYYEYLILRKYLNHENIVLFRNLLIDENFYYYIFEYCSNGDLRKYISKHIQTSPNTLIKSDLLWKWFRNLSDAVLFIHNNNLIHMDIKPSNIMLDEEFNLKLGDFDSANDVSTNRIDKCVRSQKLNPEESADATYSPELIRGDEFSFEVDIWAVGTVFYELIYLESIDSIVQIVKSDSTWSGRDVLIKNKSFFNAYSNSSIHLRSICQHLLKNYKSMSAMQMKLNVCILWKNGFSFNNSY